MFFYLNGEKVTKRELLKLQPKWMVDWITREARKLHERIGSKQCRFQLRDSEDRLTDDVLLVEIN